jgi:hypothetical protein
VKPDDPVPGPRPSVAVHFKCCNVYLRIYLNRQGTAFFGHCPRCTRSITINVGPGGSKSRFWTAE